MSREGRNGFCRVNIAVVILRLQLRTLINPRILYYVPVNTSCVTADVLSLLGIRRYSNSFVR